MNTVQLAQRLATRLNVRDTTLLEAEPALDVLAAINGGIQEYFAHAPSLYKRTTLSHALRAPETLSVTFTSKYANTVEDDTFATAMMGCTLRFDNGMADTVITGTNSVLDDWLHDDLTQPATVFYDVVPIQDVIEQILEPVRVHDATRANPTRLHRDERLRGGRARWRESGLEAFVTAEAGRPEAYYLEPVGGSQGGEPEFLLRVAPRPLVDYTIKFEAELGPRAVTFAELSIATTVGVPGNRIESILLPLCEAHLTASRFWRDPRAAGDVMGKAENLKGNRLRTMTGDIAPARNQMGTPAGF